MKPPRFKNVRQCKPKHKPDRAHASVQFDRIALIVGGRAAIIPPIGEGRADTGCAGQPIRP
jgi:hypothetical protein